MGSEGPETGVSEECPGEGPRTRVIEDHQGEGPRQESLRNRARAPRLESLAGWVDHD